MSPGAWAAAARAGASCWLPAVAPAGAPTGRKGGCVSLFLGGEEAPVGE